MLVPLVGIGFAYAVGYSRFSARRHGYAGYRAEAGCFIAGYLALVVALVSPIHSAGEQYFSAHMAQHLLLSLVAPPLLLLSNSMPVLLWALPPGERAALGRLVGQPGPVRTTLRSLTHPLIAWCLFVLTQWLWHQPFAYQWALENRWAHYFEHATFFGTAILFWWPVIGSPPLRSALGYPARMAYTFLAWMPNTLLGAGIALSRGPLYAFYVTAAQHNGTDARIDQELAGLIMWIPGDVLFAVILMLLLVAYMRSEERKEARIDRELDAREAARRVR